MRVRDLIHLVEEDPERIVAVDTPDGPREIVAVRLPADPSKPVTLVPVSGSPPGQALRQN